MKRDGGIFPYFPVHEFQEVLHDRAASAFALEVRHYRDIRQVGIVRTRTAGARHAHKVSGRPSGNDVAGVDDQLACLADGSVIPAHGVRDHLIPFRCKAPGLYINRCNHPNPVSWQLLTGTIDQAYET